MQGSGFRGLCDIRGKANIFATFLTSPPKTEYPNWAESSLFQCIFQVSIPENIKVHPSWNPRNKHSQDPTPDLFSSLFKCSRSDFIPTEDVFVTLPWKVWPENEHRHLSWTSWHFIRSYMKPETGREGSREKETKERKGRREGAGGTGIQSLSPEHTSKSKLKSSSLAIQVPAPPSDVTLGVSTMMVLASQPLCFCS